MKHLSLSVNVSSSCSMPYPHVLPCSHYIPFNWGFVYLLSTHIFLMRQVSSTLVGFESTLTLLQLHKLPLMCWNQLGMILHHWISLNNVVNLFPVTEHFRHTNTHEKRTLLFDRVDYEYFNENVWWHVSKDVDVMCCGDTINK